MIQKIIKNIKNRLKPSAGRQIRKVVSKNPSVEHAFVKLPRKRLADVSKDSSKYTVDIDVVKVRRYLQENNGQKNKLSTIHTHLYEKGNKDLPSFIDIYEAMLDRSYQHISVFNKKKEIGRITYIFRQNKNQSVVANISTKIKTNILKLSSELENAKKILSPEKYKLFKTEYNNIYNQTISLIFITEKQKWAKKNPSKNILDFYKELGLSIRFIPNKKEGYYYDYEKLEFVKK